MVERDANIFRISGDSDDFAAILQDFGRQELVRQVSEKEAWRRLSMELARWVVFQEIIRLSA